MYTAVLSKLTRDFAIDPPRACQSSSADFGMASLTITNIDTSFMYLGYALIVCALVGLAEIFAARA